MELAWLLAALLAGAAATVQTTPPHVAQAALFVCGVCLTIACARAALAMALQWRERYWR